MEYDINDLDWEDDSDVLEESNEPTEAQESSVLENTPNDNEVDLENSNNSENTELEDEDLISSILKSKGISDPTKIKFESDDGKIEELNFNDLSREELINILTQNDNQQFQENALDDAEINLINTLRKNNFTPEEYQNYLIQVGENKLKEQINKQQEIYKIDELSDEELYILDLQSRIPEITDEEALQSLEKAKSNSDLFDKQLKGIRDEYIRLEDENNTRIKLEQEEQQKLQFENFSNKIQESILNFNNFGDLGVELDDNEAEELAQFLLTSDAAGVNYFSKALNNPDNLVKTAWFLLKGENALKQITDSFESEIAKARQEGYKLGLQDSKPKSKFVYQPKNNNINKTNQKDLTIFDLD